jgi:hypothetical protein
MDNQHRKITGYRELTQPEIDLMNEAKELEAKWNGFVDRLRAMGSHPQAGPGSLDQRCVALAATHAEIAFMYAVRSVAKPERKVA